MRGDTEEAAVQECPRQERELHTPAPVTDQQGPRCKCQSSCRLVDRQRGLSAILQVCGQANDEADGVLLAGYQKKDSQAPLRHTKLLTTVASSRTWRSSRVFVAQDLAITLHQFLAERVRFELTVLSYTRVPGVHLKPLGHLSVSCESDLSPLPGQQEKCPARGHPKAPTSRDG